MEHYQVTGSEGQILMSSGGQVVMQAMPGQFVSSSGGGHAIQTQSGQVNPYFFSTFLINLSNTSITVRCVYLFWSFRNICKNVLTYALWM